MFSLNTLSYFSYYNLTFRFMMTLASASKAVSCGVNTQLLKYDSSKVPNLIESDIQRNIWSSVRMSPIAGLDF